MFAADWRKHGSSAREYDAADQRALKPGCQNEGGDGAAAILRGLAVRVADRFRHRPLVFEAGILALALHRRSGQQVSDLRHHLRDRWNSDHSKDCEPQILML